MLIRQLAVAAGLVLAATVPAAADEAKAPVSASMLLNIFSAPAEARGAAFDQALREEGPSPAGPLGGVIQPDGSVRYGSVTVTVKNPCPPGTTHYEPPPLPGRRARN